MNFTLPTGVEVPELRKILDQDDPIAVFHYEENARVVSALCRVVREQDAMLRLAVSSYSVNDPDEAIGLLRRRVREEDKHEA